MAIKRRTAYKMAIKALEKEIKLYCFGATLYDRKMTDAIFAKRDSEKVARINEAIGLLEKEMDYVRVIQEAML